jgi:hypothetical protein
MIRSVEYDVGMEGTSTWGVLRGTRPGRGGRETNSTRMGTAGREDLGRQDSHGIAMTQGTSSAVLGSVRRLCSRGDRAGQIQSGGRSGLNSTSVRFLISYAEGSITHPNDSNKEKPDTSNC